MVLTLWSMISRSSSSRWIQLSHSWQPWSGRKIQRSRQRSHLAPVTPGRHSQRPVCGSQELAPSDSHWQPERFSSGIEVVAMLWISVQRFVLNTPTLASIRAQIPVAGQTLIATASSYSNVAGTLACVSITLGVTGSNATITQLTALSSFKPEWTKLQWTHTI